MTADDEDKAQKAPSEPPRVLSPTPPPPDMSIFDEVTGRYDDPIEALASIITPPPRPVEEEELRPEDAIDPTPEPSASRETQASRPDLAPASSRGSQPDRDSTPEIDPDERLSPVPSKPAAIVPDAAASRRARARITLRIPDDDIPVSNTSPQPPPAAESEPDVQILNPVAVVHAMRIIAIGEPQRAAPAEPQEEAPSRARQPSEVDVVPLSEGDIQPPATDEVEVEPEPDDDATASPPPVVALPPVAPPRPRMASIPPVDGASPPAPAVAYGPLPSVEPPRPRMASVPPGGSLPTPSAPPVAAYGALPAVEPPRPRMASMPPVDLPRPRMASMPPVDLPTPSAPPVTSYGPLPPVEPPRPRMPSVPPVDPPTPSAPPVITAPHAEPVELEDDEVAPDSSQRNEAEPATVRAPVSDGSPVLPPVTPPAPKAKPTPSPPQTAPVMVSTEDVLAVVSPIPAPASVEEVAPELDEEEVVVEAGPPVQAPPPVSLKPATLPEPKPAARKPAASDDTMPRRRVRPPWEEVFADDFVRAFPRLTPKQISGEVTFVEESLGVQRGGVVLDLACGAGQHAVEFASRGYNVVGYDLSLTMLALAADEAQERGQKINFLQGDMREMAFEEMFDAVYSWATSFGFFDEDKNASVLRRVNRALRQSGMFLLDLVNRDFIVPRLPALNWFEGDGCVCIDDAQFDSITSRLRVKRTIMREDGKSREVEYSVRLYSLHEIGKMLHDSGFKVVEVSGHPATAGAYFGADSPRMIILAERR